MASAYQTFTALLAAKGASAQADPAAITTVVTAIHSGLPFVAGANVFPQIKAALEDVKAAPSAVESALTVIKELSVASHANVEAFTLPLLGAVADKMADKSAHIVTLARSAAEEIIRDVNPAAVGVALSVLFEGLNLKKKWQSRVLCLALIGEIAELHPAVIKAHYLPDIIPRLSECMTDVRKEVADEAKEALTEVSTVIENKDIFNVIPVVIETISKPAQTSEGIHALSATTFVQAVDESVLSMLVPLLQRGLVERSTPIKRMSAVIIGNMVKLVMEPKQAAPLLPKLLPGVKKLAAEVSDPECRNVANKCLEVMLNAAGVKTEEEGLALAAKMAAAIEDKKAKKEAPKAAAAKPKNAFKKPAAAGAKKGASGAAAEVEEAPAKELDPAVAGVLAALKESLSLANLDLTTSLVSAAVESVPEAAAAAGGEAVKDEEESPAAAAASSYVDATLEYVAQLGASLVSAGLWTPKAWSNAIAPYVAPLVRLIPALAVNAALATEKSEAVCLDVLNKCYFNATGKVRSDIPEDSAEVTDPDAEDATIPDLCDCEFSLAYGGKILLNTAKLHMKVERRYGLIGPNGCGKTTLMRAIANEQLEGFPTKAQLRTVYVESMPREEETDLKLVDYVLANDMTRESVFSLAGLPIPTDADAIAVPMDATTCAALNAANGAGSIAGVVPLEPVVFVLKTMPDTVKAIVDNKLAELGFTPDLLKVGTAGTLSGGWRMKLALARAILSRKRKADAPTLAVGVTGSDDPSHYEPLLLLLDEPSNHLDVENTRWLINYLKEMKGISCLVVSHDSQLLDQVCTHIVHYEGFKLRTYKGNLSAFVEKKPEAKAYYELSATQINFCFPEPGFLDGVKSMDKAILKASHCTYTYPTRDSPAIKNASVAISLSSRVVIHGRNGQGKSTLVKLLTGEIEPQQGGVWKHPSLRVAYVAQHAFHHINEHLTKTPSEYIQWRYATGEDRELLGKASRQISAEEQKKMDNAIVINGVKQVVKEILARRKSGRSYEYEVSFVGLPADKNQWLMRDYLESIGWGKAVDALDSREAAAAGLHSKPLTSANIAKHLEHLGLDQEFTLHNRIAGLSGGQKVKVVLGAALWQNPQVIIMDEPSNFLDRDSLGALAVAIKAFQGGVLLVTHNREFSEELCSETWNVDNGEVSTTGGSWKNDVVEKPLEADEVMDAYGNVVKVTQKLTGKAARKAAKDKAKRRKAGEDVSDDEDF